MKVSILSDLHIKIDNPNAIKLLEKFFLNEDVLSSDSVVFLGDIFDLMVGNHQEYIEQYSMFFDGIRKLISMGIEVHYIEGNHDFHLSKLFNNTFVDTSDMSRKFYFHHVGFFKTINNKKVYFGHGDELDLGNWSYHIYTKFIRSPFMRLIIDHVAGHRLIDFIGNRASKASRKRGTKRVSVDREARKLRYRKFCEILAKDNPDLDYIICGHTHFEDDVMITDKCRYINAGDARKTKKYIHLNERGAELKNISK